MKNTFVKSVLLDASDQVKQEQALKTSNLVMPAGFDTQATSQMTKSSQEQALKNSNTFGDAGGV